MSVCCFSSWTGGAQGPFIPAFHVAIRHRLRRVQRRGLQRDHVCEHGQGRRLRRLRVRLPVERPLLRGHVETNHADILGGQALQGLRNFRSFAQSGQFDHRCWGTPQECFVAHGEHSRTGGQQSKRHFFFPYGVDLFNVSCLNVGAYPVARPEEHWVEGLHGLQVASHPQTQNRLYKVRLSHFYPQCRGIWHFWGIWAQNRFPWNPTGCPANWQTAERMWLKRFQNWKWKCN